MKTMQPLFSLKEAHTLAQQYGVPLEDVLLIGLNRYGVCAEIEDKRIRFKLQLLMHEELFYLAVCVNTYESPFSLRNKKLYLKNEVIGNIIDPEKDTCDTTYYRRNKTELTLNSNMRSQCKGCTFCGTYNLDPEDKVDMSTDDMIRDFISKYMWQNNVQNMRHLVRVTVCTGCFMSEDILVDHLISVYHVFSEFGFDKRIRYIGSQIRSKKAMDKIAENIPHFSLSLTVECFSKRSQRMRTEKGSLRLSDIHDLLGQSLQHGFSTNYLYIAGLDDIDTMKEGLVKLSDCINRMPVIQILQSYTREQEYEREDFAREIPYYLDARKMIEEIFENKKFLPRSWENYRGLFYLTYQNQEFRCIRI